MKKCRKCKEWKPLTSFSINKKSKDGYCNRCKDCDRDYYLENKERALRIQAKYRLTHKETKKEFDRVRYSNNPEKMREEANERRRKRILRDPKGYKEVSRKYRKRIGKEKQWLQLYLSNDGCCLWCFEINPFMLNKHHVWGRKNADETYTFCENHHALFSRNRNGLFEFLADL